MSATARCLRLVDRLRGIYTIPVNDGAGPLNGKMTYTPAEPFPTPPIQKEAADHIERLDAVARLAAECWDRWERLHEQQEAIRKSGRPMPSWPRDEFEGYLDALQTDAPEALK
jgi:hypothetical protein